MLLVKTYLDKSTIEGIGLFTGQDIKKDEITWKYTPGFDLAIEPDEVEKMPQLLKDFVLSYAALSMLSGKYILGSDNVRFTNHSSDANLESVQIEGELEKIARAKRDIKKGEELTIDYRTFDQADATSDRKYLKGDI